MKKCARCGKNNQSPGAEPYCGSCWSRDTSNTMDWPGYEDTTQAMLATGKRCRKCYRQLYALPGDRAADVCEDCY